MSTVFEIEPIGFQQNMQVEHGYHTGISDFEFSENLENNYQMFFFKKNPRKFLIF